MYHFTQKEIRNYFSWCKGKSWKSIIFHVIIIFFDFFEKLSLLKHDFSSSEKNIYKFYNL